MFLVLNAGQDLDIHYVLPRVPCPHLKTQQLFELMQTPTVSCFISKLFHLKAIKARMQQCVGFWNGDVIFTAAITNKEMGDAIREMGKNRKLQSMQKNTQRDATQVFIRHTICSPASVYTCHSFAFRCRLTGGNNTGQCFPPSQPFLALNLSRGPLGWVQVSRLHCFPPNCARC